MTRNLLFASMLSVCGCTALVDGVTERATDETRAEEAEETDETEALECGETAPPWTTLCPEECSGGCIAGVCTIACTGEDACKDDRRVCPDGLDCLLSCEGEKSCEKVELECSPDVRCDVRCLGEGACLGATVLAAPTGAMSLVCADEKDACKDTEVRCDTSACAASCHGPSQPDLLCGESCSCQPCVLAPDDD